MSILSFVKGLFSCPRCVTLVGDVLRLRDQRDRARRSLSGAHAIVSDLLAEVLRLRAQNECQKRNVGFATGKADELRAENTGLRIELKTWQDGARMAPAHFDQNSRLAAEVDHLRDAVQPPIERECGHCSEQGKPGLYGHCRLPLFRDGWFCCCICKRRIERWPPAADTATKAVNQ